MTTELQDYARWIGRTQTETDLVTVAAMEGFAAMLDRDDPKPEPGDPVPPMWNWVLFAPKARWSELGPDGHPARGGFLPPVALPRRMFAGARYIFHQPLRVGETVTRTTEIADVTAKTGASGELIFVKLAHRVSGENGLAIEEEHDVVYRDVTAPAKSPVKEEPEEIKPDWRATFTPDPVVLFRYSALTFIGHRIHYDRTYATQEEGYPGLVVHGPLIATLLMELVRNNEPDLAIVTYRFRAKRPLFDLHAFETVGGFADDGAGFWVKAIDHEGAVAMEASGSFAG